MHDVRQSGHPSLWNENLRSILTPPPVLCPCISASLLCASLTNWSLPPPNLKYPTCFCFLFPLPVQSCFQETVINLYVLSKDYVYGRNRSFCPQVKVHQTAEVEMGQEGNSHCGRWHRGQTGIGRSGLQSGSATHSSCDTRQVGTLRLSVFPAVNRVG